MTPDEMRRMRMRRTNWLMAYASFASTKAVAEWTPEELFAASEVGVWYDPSDFDTMFQDSAGTTPVTAVEQPVGLLLDKSKGLVVGSELLGSGTVGLQGSAPVATYNTSTGAGTVSRVAAFNQSFVSFAVTSGRTYLVDIENTGGFTLAIRPASLGAALVTVPAGTRTTARLTATDAALAICAAGDASTVTFTVYSIALLAGNHASQATSGSRPVLRATDRLDFDGSDDKLTAAASGAGTTGFLFVAGINLDTIGANQTIWSDTGTNTGYRVRINSSNQIELAAGNGSAYTTVTTVATLSAATNYVIAAWHDGTNLNVKLGTDGTVAQAAFATATAGSASFTVGMDNGAVSSQLNGKIYNAIYVKNFAGSLADVNNAITYVNGTLA